MPTYRVKDPDTGRALKVTGDSPPTEQELEELFSAVQAPEAIKEPTGATRDFGAGSDTQFDKYGIAGALFPRTTRSTEMGGNVGERVLAGMGDAATLPQRGVAAGASMAGYALGGGKLGDAATLGAQELSRYKPTEDTKGALRFAQDVAYDPAFIPGLMAGTTEARLISKAPGVLKAAVPAISGALQTGGSSAIQQATEGDVKAGETSLAAGLGAAIPLAAAGVGAAAKKVAGETGKRLIQALVRPGQRGLKEGFDADYIMKDKELLNAAGGGIEKLQEVLQTKFNNLAGSVREIQKATGMDVQVDVPAVYFRVAKKLKASNEFTGMQRELKDAIDGLLDNLQYENFDEFTDLATAMKLRTNYGTKINWQPAISTGGRKAAFGASAEEKVYDTFYKELSDEIKKKAPEEIAQIDEQFTKLIPVLKAVNRRVPIETSNLPIGLMETVGGAGLGGIVSGVAGEGDIGDRVKRGIVGAAGGALVAKGLKSPRLGQALYGMSKVMGPPPAAATALPLSAALEEWRQKRAAGTTREF